MIRVGQAETLPAGYAWGAHLSGPGWSGHWIIRERDGAACVGSDAGRAHRPPTAAMIDREIAEEQWAAGDIDDATYERLTGQAQA